MISLKYMFQQSQPRYVRAEKFREEQNRKFKRTFLEVNSPLTVKFIDKVTKIKKIQLRTKIKHKECNVNIKVHKSKALNLTLKACHI